MAKPPLVDRGQRYAVKAFKAGSWIFVAFENSKAVADSLARTYRTDPAIAMTHVEDRGEEQEIN